MGQFDRVAFKQSGENLFDSLFDFDRKLKDTMAYANIQKNGSLDERLQMNKLELEMSLLLDSVHQEEIVNHRAVGIEKQHNVPIEQIQINITDDVGDEAVYGRNRHRLKPRWR